MFNHVALERQCCAEIQIPDHLPLIYRFRRTTMLSFASHFDRLRQLVRRLAATPVFTAVTLLTLAISIGANTAIFSVVEGVLLKPLPYPEADRLVGVWYTAPGINIKELNMAPYLYFTVREQAKSIVDIGGYDYDSFTVTGSGEPEQMPGMDVTSGTLPLLGARPALGRLFTEADDKPDVSQTVVLSYQYWQKRFGGSASAIGSTIQLDGRSRQVIGVLPQNFHFLDNENAAVFVPMQWDRSKVHLGNFNDHGIMRLKPGVTLAQASTEMVHLIQVATHNFPAPPGFDASIIEQAKVAPSLRPLKQDVVGNIGNVLWVLMGSLGMVLLIACANVANLLLVRVEGRSQELAIRAALGAGWGRIAADLLLESLVLGAAGSMIGLALAQLGLRGLVAAAPAGLPRLHEIGIDGRVLLFTFGIGLITSLFIGAIPVLRYAGGRSAMTLREGGRGQSQSRRQGRARNGLVVLQIALALILLICSGLMIQTFRAMTKVDPGFRDPNSLLTFRLYIPDTTIPDSEPDRLMRSEMAIQDKIASLPGVSAVTMGSSVPMDGRSSNDPVFAQDRTYAQNQLPGVRRFKFIAPGYLATLGTPIVTGRDFTWQDNFDRLPVALVSENFAREYWHDAHGAIGKRIRVGNNDPWREIIGVVANTYDDGVSEEPPAEVYWPLLMGPFEGQKDRSERYLTIAVRTPQAASAVLLNQVKQAVWSVNAGLPLANPNTLGYLYNKSMARTSFTLVLLSIAGAMALLLGVVGIFGVVSYGISQRTREIGIRMALGAQRREITALFVRQGFVLTVMGVVIGLGASALTMRFLSSLLFHVSAIDPFTYASVTAVIVAVTWVACYLPSRRAASVEPVTALRSE
jgi:predicted permease